MKWIRNSEISAKIGKYNEERKETEKLVGIVIR